MPQHLLTLCLCVFSMSPAYAMGDKAVNTQVPERINCANISFTKGFVRIIQSGSRIASQAEIGSTICEGSELLTLENGYCQVNFTKDTFIRLSPKSHLILKRYDLAKSKFCIVKLS